MSDPLASVYVVYTASSYPVSEWTASPRL